MEDKGKLFLIVKCELRNIEVMTKLENHHFTTIILIIVLGMNN